ncbi:uncharacterized protein PG998_008925 [Apiospora kogelbergensis]|uniref:uncharacterized protein n=1 Tax=Apiospora kogelbergensis TaxID=1337665 RepID=UPI00312D9E7E
MSLPTHPPRRKIHRLLIANRGEIATRIIQASRESSLETFALVTPNDKSHAQHATHVLDAPSPRSYTDIPFLVGLARKHHIDAVHPGYGFLSESADFARRMWRDAGAVVIGPGGDVLEQTGDKLAAKALARRCGVPTLSASDRPTSHYGDVLGFARRVGFPVMLKAVDGGGGKGIRLVRTEALLESATQRAIAESPSRQVFVEKAAVDGFRHIEVQIVGDGTGAVRHLWERECSIQRRYQKVVELAPSTIGDRQFVARIIRAAVRMAEAVKYLSLGTFEFLANQDTQEFFFLEINPRIQVEHTVTESITGLDLVKIQLDIAQGVSLDSLPLSSLPSDPVKPPRLWSVQLRLTAENVHNDWSLSIGRITNFSLPTGNGIRIDTHLVPGSPMVIGADFDSLLAKIIVTGGSWSDVVAKCRRALEDTRIDGVKTNLDALHAIAASPDFAKGACDTSWLEKGLPNLLETGKRISENLVSNDASIRDDSSSTEAAPGGGSGSTLLLRKGDAWALKLAPQNGASEQASEPPVHHLKLSRVLRNEFPALLRAEVEYAHPGAAAPQTFLLEAASSTASAGSIMAASKHRRGNASDPAHVVAPFPGRLVEVLVDEGDAVRPGQVVCVVQQMKMELEVRAARAGRVRWVTEAEDGEDIAEGTLIAELEDVADVVVAPGGDETRAKL